MSLVNFISRRIHESGFLFDRQQRWTSANYRTMCREFRRFAARNHRLLDLGCATSGCVQHIWEGLEPYYVGVDLTLGYLRWGIRRHPKACMVRANLGTLPFRKLPFDFVCVFSVLHHLDDPTVRALGKHLEELLPREARVLVAEPVFPPQKPVSTLSDRLSHFLLENDRGRHIRSAEDYVALMGDWIEIVSAWRFIYGVHHFCGFELRRRDGM